MRILYCHNYYQFRGGEDVSFEADVTMLRDAGHDVTLYTVDNRDLIGRSRIRTARETIWNFRAANAIESLIVEHRPDVLHCNNTFPQISPSVYYAANKHGCAGRTGDSQLSHVLRKLILVPRWSDLREVFDQVYSVERNSPCMLSGQHCGIDGHRDASSHACSAPIL